MDNEYDTKTMIYNRKRDEKKGKRKKNIRKKGGWRNTTVEGKEEP